MHCPFRHTKIDPPEGAYICPRCGSSEFFVMDSENYDCEKMHSEDLLECEDCSFDINGKNFVDLYIKKQKLTKCPNCKGTGYVKIKHDD